MLSNIKECLSLIFSDGYEFNNKKVKANGPLTVVIAKQKDYFDINIISGYVSLTLTQNLFFGLLSPKITLNISGFRIYKDRLVPFVNDLPDPSLKSKDLGFSVEDIFNQLQPIDNLECTITNSDSTIWIDMKGESSILWQSTNFKISNCRISLSSKTILFSLESKYE